MILLQEYAAVGAHIQEDMSEASLIIGVKSVPIDLLMPNKTYAFFSHTIKAQKENMPLLDAVMDKVCLLYIFIVPIDLLMPNKTYAFFSHTIKAQKENMPLLDAVMDKVCLWHIVIIPIDLRYTDAQQDVCCLLPHHQSPEGKHAASGCHNG